MEQQISMVISFNNLITFVFGTVLVAFGIAIALTLYFHNRMSSINKFYALYIGVSCAWLVPGIIWWYLHIGIPKLMFVQLCFGSFLAPLFYYFSRTMEDGEYRPRRLDLLWLLPALFFFTAYVYHIFSPTLSRSYAAGVNFDGSNTRRPADLLYYLYMLYNIIGHLVGFWYLGRAYWKAKDELVRKRNGLVFFTSLTGVILLIAIISVLTFTRLPLAGIDMSILMALCLFGMYLAVSYSIIDNQSWTIEHVLKIISKKEAKLKGLLLEFTRQAQLDPLTQVYNRRMLTEILEKEIERTRRYGEPLSVAMLDIDHFKLINDTYGHKAGDQVLTQLARVGKEQLRTVDVFARWGGEEFMIVMPHTDASGAVIVAEKIRTCVANYHFGIPESVTCSFGVCRYDTSMDQVTFLSAVDQAMYMAKGAGRNCVRMIDPGGTSLAFNA